MLDVKVIKQVTDLMAQALSDESIDLAEPMSDAEIKLLSATLEGSLDDGDFNNEMTIVSGPKELIDSIENGNLSPADELQARKTLRRFYELFLTLSSEPETRILN
jgi:hypothetical protein